MADLTLTGALTGTLPNQAPPPSAPPQPVEAPTTPAPGQSDPNEDYEALKAQVSQLYQQNKSQIDQEIALNDQAAKLTKEQQQPGKRGWVLDTALAVPGGLVDGFYNVINKVEQWGTWIDNHAHIPSLHIGTDGVYFHKTEAAHVDTPEWAQAQTVPGSLVHGAAQFAVGFALTRGVSAEAAAVADAGKLALNAVRGGVAMSAAFEPHEKNLANLIAEHSELAAPVAKYLAVQDDDSEATAELKNLVVGSTVTVAGDAVFAGFMRGLKAIKAVRQQGALETATLDSPKVPADPPSPRAADTALYAPESPVFDMRTNAAQRESIDSLKARGASQEELLAEIEKARKTRPDTGMLNKQAYAQDAASAETAGLPIAHIDGTAFKTINDTFGHTVGDQVILRQAEEIQKAIGEAGIVYHQGGDEFAVIGKTPSTDIDSLLKQAQGKLSTLSIKGTRGAETATRSNLGFDYGVGATKDAADEALYAAKQARKARDGAAAEAGYVSRNASDGVGERGAVGTSGEPAGQAKPTLETIVEPHLKPSQAVVDDLTGRLAAGDDSSLNEPILNFNKDGIDLAKVASLHGDDARLAVERILNATSKGYAEGMAKAGNGVKTWKATTQDAADLGMSLDGLNRVYGQYTEAGGIAAHVKASRDLLVSSAQKVREVAAKLHNTGAYEDVLALKRQLGFHAMVQAQAKGIQKEVARALNSMKLSAYGEGSQFKTAQEAIDAIEGAGGHAPSMSAILKLAGDLKDAKTLRDVNNVAQQSVRQKLNAVALHIYRNGLLSSPNGVVIWGNAVKFALGIISRAGAVGVGKVRTALGGKSATVTPQEFWQAHIVGAKQGFQDALRIPVRSLADAGGKIAAWDAKGAAELLARDEKQYGTTWRSIVKGENITDYATRENMHPSSPLAVDKESAAAAGSDFMRGLARKFGFASPDGAERWASFGDKGGRAWALATNMLDKVIGIPVRGVIASDELFRTVAARQMNTSLAFQRAVQEAKAGGLQDAKYAQYVQGRVSTLVKNPELMGEDAAKEAVDYARYQVFQEKGGPITQAIQKLLNAVPELRFVLPFVNTPSNIIRQTFEWSPVPLAKVAPRLLGIKTEYYKMLAAGGPKADEAIARMAIGTGMLTLGYGLATQGLITGGHPGGSSRTGGLPLYSIKLGKNWYQFNRLEPVGSYFGIVADLTEILNKGVDPHTGEHDDGALSLMAAAGLAVSKNVVDKSWMQSMSVLLDALSNPDEGGKGFVHKQLPGLIPYSGLLNKIAQEDGTAKEVFTLMDAFKARLPYFNSQMAPRRDILGRPITTTQPYDAGWYSPVNITPEATGKVDKELQRLATLGVAGAPKMPDKSINGIPLTAEQYSRYLELTGQTVKVGGRTLEQQLEHVMDSKEYQRLTDGTQELPGSRLYVVNRYINAYRQYAQREMLKEYPQLDTEAKAKLGRKFEAKTGKVAPGLEQYMQAVQQQQ